jgi:hypothetical protein
MGDDYPYFKNKKTDKTYASRRLKDQIRIASKVFDTQAAYQYALEKSELVIRELPGTRHEIVAKFVEADRHVFILTFQKWRMDGDYPLERVHFSFFGDEIPRICDFLDHIKKLHFPNADKINVLDSDLRVVAISDADVRRLITENLPLVMQIVRNEITEGDVTALAYRREQLQRFKRLLFDRAFFDAERARMNCKPEDVWQKFFESNQWIFGYGLSYVFTSGLDQKKLEQTVRGASIVASGKRVDGLLKTQALINALCFVEIKRHDTDLLESKEYRSDVWPASLELVGGVAQLQETIRASLDQLKEKYLPDDTAGNPTGEELYSVQPRSFLVIGSLSEFQTEHGTNTRKYRCFEAFRRNIRQPEVITFDELYYRAKFIVEHASDNMAAG